MENYKVRMLFELLDLVDKINRLKAALDKGMSLNEKQSTLLDRQLKCMREYKDILTERLVIELGDEEYGRNNNE